MFEAVIGLETHIQLNTRSKIFCACKADSWGDPPNTNICPVCTGLPGVLPALNRAVVDKAARLAAAMHVERLAGESFFARKNYFYPDLPKGYQISQYEQPIVQGGELKIIVEGREKSIRLTRAHLEEDAGKSLHEDFHGLTGIDLNRAGTPLLEVVSEPDLRGAQEAVAYARALHALVVWIGICDGNMQEGSFRCDANVSVRRAGDANLGTRCEIKNLNSFRFMERAIEYEARRQIALIEDGGRVEQETRLYDPERDETRSMRTKEEAHDYRYFPDPDLLPLVVSEEDIEAIRRSLPELPAARRDRFAREYGLTPHEAGFVAASRAAADYFEALVKASGAEARLCANWQMGELAAALNQDEIEISKSKVPAKDLAGLLGRIADGTLSGKLAKEVFDAMWAGEGAADAIIEKRGLRQISDAGAIEKLVEEVLAANPKQVEDYRAGKEKAFNSLVGQVMKATKGKANPTQVTEILRRKLAR